MQTGTHAVEMLQHEPVLASADSISQPQVRGKFLYAGEEKLYVRGVTYGTFRPTTDGDEYDRGAVERDFAQMVEHGINAVRVYKLPPPWLLDAAQRHELHVMVGLSWEQHVAFLEDRGLARSIEERIRTGVRTCAGHPAVLCYVVGNEIPASIVRWHGARRVERFLERLYLAVKAEDPGALVTYVNYPSTEYLRLDFVDIICFNVYLESREPLERYLARLHNLAYDRPLLLTEVGLDSLRNGELKQAAVLDWQVHTAFASGCAGAFVFAWTDEWHVGGRDIEDWNFGLTARDRQPKPALAAVRDAFTEVPFRRDLPWPRISVVVCSHNGARTIRDTMEGLRLLDYPNFEIIVVDDGSTDATAMIAGHYDVRLIRIENRGLSNARNAGLAASTGEIVAYIDDDARPDPHWLTYLAATFLTTEHAGIGGPNIAPPGDGLIADCVANAPGGPVHVLLTDQVAEHIPGCNMAFRKDRLKAIGGFDPRFRVAGDDVDICWRLQEEGWTLGFSPAALVWHHRRNSVRTYWKQQQGYGKAEALLEAKWPERFNAVGHVSWAGRLYGEGLTKALGARRGRIYHGNWGSAPFQSVYEPASGFFASLPLMPEWWIIVAVLTGFSLLGIWWTPLLVTLPFALLALLAPVAQAIVSARHARFTNVPSDTSQIFKLQALTAFLHLIQPLARLRGRLRFGLTPWRRRGSHGWRFPRSTAVAVWSEEWRSPDYWLSSVETLLRERGVITTHGGNFATWDLDVRGGMFGGARMVMAIEEHGAGKQLVRFRVTPRSSITWVVMIISLGVLAVAAGLDGVWLVSGVLGAGASVVIVATVLAAGTGVSSLVTASQGEP
jgi:GT2 family glycosyltransferase